MLKLKAQSRSFIRWWCKLFRMQVSLGGRAVFEHPTGAKTWMYDEVHVTIKLHTCRFGLQLPHSEKLIRKSTRLFVTHEDMKGLERRCPGSADPHHRCT